MKKVAIFGAGLRAREMKRLLQLECNIETDLFIVDAEYKRSEFFDSTPVCSTEDFFKGFSPQDVSVYLGIGMPKMNRIREKLFEEFHKNNFSFETFVSNKATVLTDDIGEGCTIFPGAIVGLGVKMGKGNNIASGVLIGHDDTIGNYNFFAPSCVLCGDIRIHNGCFFGANCTVRNSVEIADYTLVGAGAYVSKSTDSFDVVVPARSVTLKEKNSKYFMDK